MVSAVGDDSPRLEGPTACFRTRDLATQTGCPPGFNLHRRRRGLPDEREDLEQLDQYIIRNPFADYETEPVMADAIE
jgi:hypothetical protein